MSPAQIIVQQQTTNYYYYYYYFYVPFILHFRFIFCRKDLSFIIFDYKTFKKNFEDPVECHWKYFSLISMDKTSVCHESFRNFFKCVLNSQLHWKLLIIVRDQTCTRQKNMTSALQVLKFSKPCRWGFRPSRIQEYNTVSWCLEFGPLGPRRRMPYVPLNCRQPTGLWRSVTGQQNQFLLLFCYSSKSRANLINLFCK